MCFLAFFLILFFIKSFCFSFKIYYFCCVLFLPPLPPIISYSLSWEIIVLSFIFPNPVRNPEHPSFQQLEPDQFHCFTPLKTSCGYLSVKNYLLMLSEISQSEKDKCHMIAFICGIYWTNWTNKQNRDRLIDGEQMTASGGGRAIRSGGIEQKGKRAHQHGQQCGDCWRKGGYGD